MLFRSDQVTGCVDVLPTILDAVNFQKTPEKKFDGMSILPVLKGEKNKIERDLYLGSGAMVNSEWKLVKKDAKRILSFIEIEEDMLFRISADPNETTNVRDQYPDVYNELLEKVRSFETIEPTMTPPPDAKPKDFAAPHEWEIILIPCPADK